MSRKPPPDARCSICQREDPAGGLVVGSAGTVCKKAAECATVRRRMAMANMEEE